MINFKLHFFSLFIFSLFISGNFAFAETLSGSTYTMEGGMVYQSETVNGSNYSLSGSGEPIVGSSNGSSFSQTGGVYSAPQATTDSGSLGSTGSAGSTVRVTAYSYAGQTLTFIVESYPLNLQSVFLLDKDEKKIEPTRVNLINDKGAYIIVFEKVPAGDFSLHFTKGSIFLFNREESIFTVSVTKEGSGIVNGPDSSILIEEGELKTDLEKGGVVAPKRSVEIQSVQNKDDKTCKFFSLSCLSYIKIYLLLISYFFLAYAIYRLIKKIVLRIFK